MKRSYELMLVFRPDTDVTDKNASDKIGKLVGEGVAVDSVSILGKKTLAYPLAKQKEGLYVLAILSGQMTVPVLEKRVQLDGSVLRFLVTTK